MEPARISDLNLIFSNVTRISISFVGLAVLVVLIYAGFQFLGAAGDKEATQKAYRTINYAIRGLILAISAWIIINLVGRFVGIDFSLFTICLPGQLC